MNTVTSAEPTVEDTKTALQLVCDYLSDVATIKLLNASGFSSEDLKPGKKENQPEKRKAEWEIDLEVEKETSGFTRAQPKTNSISTDTSSNKKKPTPAPVKKPIAGVKSITSFFGKK